jgi:hypothetical protein
LAALAACLFFATSNVEAQRPYYFGQTTDPTPVDVAIQDKSEVLHFRIPKMYMTFSENWKGGLQPGITLETLFPSMAPTSAGANTDATRLVIRVNSYLGDYRMSTLLPNKIFTQWAFVENVTDAKNRSYRLYVNKEDVERRKDPAVMIKEFFVPSGEQFYLECLREIKNPFVGCALFANFGQNLILSFVFKQSQFEKWPEIHEAVLNLLNSFRRQNTLQ